MELFDVVCDHPRGAPGGPWRAASGVGAQPFLRRTVPPCAIERVSTPPRLGFCHPGTGPSPLWDQRPPGGPAVVGEGAAASASGAGRTGEAGGVNGPIGTGFAGPADSSARGEAESLGQHGCGK